MPLLFNEGGIKIIITSLNILGDQNVSQLASLGIKGINLTGANSTDKVFKDIEQGLYRVLVVSPERILSDSRFDTLWSSKRFCARLFNISVDEAHCIADWGAEFRPKYAELGRLRWVIPSSVRFHAVSATMPAPTLRNVMDKLQMRKEETHITHLSNDRPNIHLIVKEMKYSASSMKDLLTLLKYTEGSRPPKFLVFTNKRSETEEAVKAEWKDIPEELRSKIRWFHSGMSAEFREAEIKKLKDGEIWGMICTDAAGMGLDIPDIELVVQWRFVPSLCTLFQRLGRAARGPKTRGNAIYFVEAQYFDGNQKKTTGKRKRTKATTSGPRKQQHQVPATTSSAEQIAIDGDVVVGEEDDNGSDQEGAVSDDGNEPDTSERNCAESHGASASHTNLAASLPPPSSMSAESYEGMAMDLFINSHSRGCCRRAVLNQYFGNSKQGVRVFHERLQEDLCCDKCFPDTVHFFPPPISTVQARRKRKFKVKKYTMGPADGQLATALERWRLQQMEQLGLGGDVIFGPQLILSDCVLDRLVQLGHLKKIPDIDSLDSQTDWRYARQYGQEVLSIIHSFYPSTVPLTSNSSLENGKRSCTACGNVGHIASNQFCPARRGLGITTAQTALPSTSSNRTCSACGIHGHISSSRVCPKWLPVNERRALQREKENLV
ncbi:hypothetical protein CPC08DRAFT_823451 [Agrocybe pediades]|nr:hypothetical protein CPC08DRAFT_823451 [Agrocybe pediades]